MDDPMDDGLDRGEQSDDNADDDGAYQGTAKDDDTSSSVDTLFKVLESGEESGGDDQEEEVEQEFQGFGEPGEGSSGDFDGEQDEEEAGSEPEHDPSAAEDFGAGSNGAAPGAAFDRYGSGPFRFRAHPRTPPSNVRPPRAVSAYHEIRDESGSLLDAFDPSCDPVLVDMCGKNASPVSRLCREFPAAPAAADVAGAAGFEAIRGLAGGSASRDAEDRVLGLATPGSSGSGGGGGGGKSILATASRSQDEGSGEDTMAGEVDRADARLTGTASACYEAADRIENGRMEAGAQAPLPSGEGSVDRVKIRKGPRVRREADALLSAAVAGADASGGLFSTLHGFAAGDVAGPRRLTRSNAGGRYVPQKNASGESVVILEISQQADKGDKLETAGASTSDAKEPSGKRTGKRSAGRGGRLGWSTSVDCPVNGDAAETAGFAEDEEEGFLRDEGTGPGPGLASVGKKKSAGRTAARKTTKAQESLAKKGAKQVGKLSVAKGRGKKAAQPVKLAAGGDDVGTGFQSAAVKRRTPRQRSKVLGQEMDAASQPLQSADSTFLPNGYPPLDDSMPRPIGSPQVDYDGSELVEVVSSRETMAGCGLEFVSDDHHAPELARFDSGVLDKSSGSFPNQLSGVSGDHVDTSSAHADVHDIGKVRIARTKNSNGLWEGSGDHVEENGGLQKHKGGADGSDVCANIEMLEGYLSDKNLGQAETSTEDPGDSAEMISSLGRDLRTLRPRRSNSDLVKGSGGAAGGHAVENGRPSKLPNTQKKKQGRKADGGTKTSTPHVENSGKRKRSSVSDSPALDIPNCREGKFLDLGKLDTAQTAAVGGSLGEDSRAGKRRKTGSSAAGKTKAASPKKATKKSSGKHHKKSKSKSKDGCEGMELSVKHTTLPCNNSDSVVKADDTVEVSLATAMEWVRTNGKEEVGLEGGEEKHVSESSHGERGRVSAPQSNNRNPVKIEIQANGGVKDGDTTLLEDFSSGVTEGEPNTHSSSTSQNGQDVTEAGASTAGWVCCDACQKWRCVPADLIEQIEATGRTWTCEENPNTDFADCSIPQEKSNAEINAELDISDESAGEDDNDKDGDDLGQQEVRPAVWSRVPCNIYRHRARKKLDPDEIVLCDCRPPTDGGPGCDEDCLNRMLLVECLPDYCPCGDACSNQQFQKRLYAKVGHFRCGKKGFGLQALENISKGSFVIEYVGEVLDNKAFEDRQKDYARHGQKHFYFMTLNGNEVIDACSKGNLGRFINHSCDPNCVTEKWLVNGEMCIGLFATRDVAMGEELTFDYNFVRVGGAAAKKCECGTPSCRGYIGGDPHTPGAVVESDSDDEDLEPIMLEGDAEDVTIPLALPPRVDIIKEQITARPSVVLEPTSKKSVAGIKRKRPAASEGDKGSAKSEVPLPVKRVKTVAPAAKAGPVKVKGLTIDTSGKQHSEIEDKLNAMLDNQGGLRKKKENAKLFLRLLVSVPVSQEEDNRGLRDLSLLLDALHKTQWPVVLREIMAKNGFMWLHNIIKQFRRHHNRIPHLRKLVKVLEMLASNGVLTPEQMYTSRPGPLGGTVESFSKSLFELCRHSDKKVQEMAMNFRRKFPPPKLPDICLKENGSPPKQLQSADLSGGRGRILNPSHMLGQGPCSSLPTSEPSLNPSVPTAGQKPTAQIWPPSGVKSGSPGENSLPEKLSGTGKAQSPCNTPTTEIETSIQDGQGVPQKRKRKSRWDQCTTNEASVQGPGVAGQASSGSNSRAAGQVSQVPSSPSGGLSAVSPQFQSDWLRQSKQGYQRQWQQPPPPKYPRYREQSPHPASLPPGPPLPPGFTPSSMAATVPGQFGPSTIPQPSMYCGPPGPPGVQGVHVLPQGPQPMHAMGMTAYPPGALGPPHSQSMPAGHHGPWHMQSGTSSFTGPPGFQVDAPERTSPWSKNQAEAGGPWRPDHAGTKDHDDEMEPEPPVPGLSPRGREPGSLGTEGTQKDQSRYVEAMQNISGCHQKPARQVEDSAKDGYMHGSPGTGREGAGSVGGSARPAEGREDGAALLGQSGYGSGRSDMVGLNRGQEPRRWEHSESAVKELARARYSSRPDFSRSRMPRPLSGDTLVPEHTEGPSKWLYPEASSKGRHPDAGIGQCNGDTGGIPHERGHPPDLQGSGRTEWRSDSKASEDDLCEEMKKESSWKKCQRGPLDSHLSSEKPLNCVVSEDMQQRQCEANLEKCCSPNNRDSVSHECREVKHPTESEDAGRKDFVSNHLGQMQVGVGAVCANLDQEALEGPKDGKADTANCELRSNLQPCSDDKGACDGSGSVAALCVTTNNQLEKRGAVDVQINDGPICKQGAKDVDEHQLDSVVGTEMLATEGQALGKSSEPCATESRVDASKHTAADAHEPTVVDCKEGECGAGKGERLEGSRGVKHNSVTWSQDVKQIEGKSRTPLASGSNTRESMSGGGRWREQAGDRGMGGHNGNHSRPHRHVDVNARHQRDGGRGSDGRGSDVHDQRSHARSVSGHHSGSHSGHRVDDGRHHTDSSSRHGSQRSDSGGRGVREDRSSRQNVDGWESPESPGFQSHVQSLVAHYLGAHKLSIRDEVKLNDRLGVQIIKKEMDKYKRSTENGVVKPIVKSRLAEKVKGFVDTQVDSYLAMKEQTRRR